jgi:hypothetical protein
VSTIDPLVTCPNPHLEALERPFTPEVLRVRERTPTTPYPFFDFTFGLTVCWCVNHVKVFHKLVQAKDSKFLNQDFLENWFVFYNSYNVHKCTYGILVGKCPTIGRFSVNCFGEMVID